MNTQKTPADFAEKYRSMCDQGIRRIYRREAQPFNGFTSISGELKSRLLVWADFNPGDVQSRLKGRILAPIKEILRDLGLTAVFAGEDFIVHSSIIQAPCGESQLSAVCEDTDFRAILLDDWVRRNGNAVPVFNLIIPDGTNILLGCTRVPQLVLDARDELIDIFARYDIHAQMPDTFHMTISRITGGKMQNLPLLVPRLYRVAQQLERGNLGGYNDPGGYYLQGFGAGRTSDIVLRW